MSIQYYPNGIGGYPPGDFLDTCRPLQTSGNVWYVSSLVGINAVSPAGQNRERPLATLAQAVTNAADDDIIVFLPGHTETLVAPQLVSKRLTFIGEGTASGKPAVSFIAGAANDLFNVSGANVEFRNLYLPESAVASSGTKMYLTGPRARVSGCYLEQGAKNTGTGITLAVGCDGTRIENSTIISTAVLTTAQPGSAIKASGPIADIEVSNTVVSAGAFGFSNYSAIDLSAGPVARLKMVGISLLLGADMALGANTTGHVNIQLSTGGSRVSWG